MTDEPKLIVGKYPKVPGEANRALYDEDPSPDQPEVTPKGSTVRVAWEKAWVKIRVPVEGTMADAWEETEIPLSVLFPTDEEFRAAVKRMTPVGNMTKETP